MKCPPILNPQTGKNSNLYPNLKEITWTAMAAVKLQIKLQIN